MMHEAIGEVRGLEAGGGFEDEELGACQGAGVVMDFAFNFAEVWEVLGNEEGGLRPVK
jgi:hypothetical protein